MIFSEWAEQLRESGYLLCPASSAVPVEVWGVRPDDVGFHFRCRGVQVRLGLYRAGRARWQVPVWDDVWCPEEALQLWEHRPVDVSVDSRDAAPHAVPSPPARLVFTDPNELDDLVVFDGSVEADWRGHDAGMLSVQVAAALFERLHEQAMVPTAGAAIAIPAARAGQGQPSRRTVASVL